MKKRCQEGCELMVIEYTVILYNSCLEGYVNHLSPRIVSGKGVKKNKLHEKKVSRGNHVKTLYITMYYDKELLIS
jgi:hypothetical protein